MAGRRVGLAAPQFAVEADAAELAMDGHPLAAPRGCPRRPGALGIVEPSREALPLFATVADETDVEAAVGWVGRRGQQQPRPDQRDRGDLDDREPPGDRLAVDADFQT